MLILSIPKDEKILIKNDKDGSEITLFISKQNGQFKVFFELPDHIIVTREGL